MGNLGGKYTSVVAYIAATSATGVGTVELLVFMKTTGVSKGIQGKKIVLKPVTVARLGLAQPGGSTGGNIDPKYLPSACK